MVSRKPLQRVRDFLEARKKATVAVTEADGPFRYRYIAISQVQGAHFPDDADDPLEIATFSEVNAKAYLTEKWDSYYEELDSGTAISSVLLGGLFGGQRFGALSRRWHNFRVWMFGPEFVVRRNIQQKSQEIREHRKKEHSGSGCGLIYVADNAVDLPLRLDAARRYGQIGIAIDGIDRGAIRSTHLPFVRSLSTAVSIAMGTTDGSPEIKFLTDGCHLNGPDGFTLHVRTFTAGAVGIVVSAPPTDELFANVERDALQLVADRKLSNASSLFALSQHKSNDNLRAFMAAWSALEFLTNTLEKRVRSEFWGNVESGNIIPPAWDRDLSKIEITEYRLKDKFFVVALHLESVDPLSDIEKFVSINQTRGDYYHRLDIAESDLPTRASQELFRKYLGLVLRG